MLRRHFLPTLAAGLLQAQARKDRQVVVISIDGLPNYAFGDMSVSMPTLRKMAREGVIAAEGMQTVNPAVTWPNHTSMVTGVTPARHGVLFNGLPVRTGENKPLRVEPWVPKHELVQATTVYDLAHAAGLTTAEVDWVAIHKPKTIKWSFAERPEPGDAIPREMVAAGMITEADVVLRCEDSAYPDLQPANPGVVLPTFNFGRDELSIQAITCSGQYCGTATYTIDNPGLTPVLHPLQDLRDQIAPLNPRSWLSAGIRGGVKTVAAQSGKGKPRIDTGKQGKHIPGHNNFQAGKSELTHPDPQALLDRPAGTGQRVSASKEVVDFGETIASG